VSRFQTVFRVFVLSVAVSSLAACGSKPSPPGPAGNAQSSAPQAQGQAPTVQQAPAAAGQTPSGRDPLMEQGAHFMSVVMEYKRRLEKDPKDKEALFFMGNANYDINRFGQAKDYYKRYLEIDPTHPGVRTDLATSYYKINDVDSAVRELKTVVAQDPNREAALYNLGLLLWQEKHDSPGAIKTWEALLKSHPNHPKASEVRKQIAEMKKKS
jgi:cytochrome c-type biogenesis protein CcmH/NrfG